MVRLHTNTIALCLLSAFIFISLDALNTNISATNPVDMSKITLKLKDCNRMISYREVIAYVPKEIDLSDDKTARLVLEKAGNFAQEKCNTPKGFDNIRVTLCQDGPNYQGRPEYTCEVGNSAVYARNYVSDRFVWNEYNNLAYTHRSHAEMARQATQQKQLQEENRRREIAAVQAREEAARNEAQAREEAEKNAARKKFEEFVKKNGVQDWPNMNNISANPFVYEGKTVAIASFFEEMLTSTEGIFRQGANYFVVSNIPKGLLTSKASVVLAGNIIGKKEVKVHEFGAKLIPHLNFIGTHFCQKDDCSDILKR